MKYHLNSKGEARVCRATMRCPFGDLESDHYESKEKAEEALTLQFKTFSPKKVEVETSYGKARLEEGLLNEAALVSLTTGPCADYALELHRKTGLPLVALLDEEAWASEEEFFLNWRTYADAGFLHAGVATPDDNFLDAYGVRTFSQLQEEFPWKFRRVSPSEEFLEAHSLMANSRNQLKSFVEATIALYEKNECLPRVEDSIVDELIEKETWEWEE